MRLISRARESMTRSKKPYFIEAGLVVVVEEEDDEEEEDEEEEEEEDEVEVDEEDEDPDAVDEVDVRLCFLIISTISVISMKTSSMNTVIGLLFSDMIGASIDNVLIKILEKRRPGAWWNTISLIASTLMSRSRITP